MKKTIPFLTILLIFNFSCNNKKIEQLSELSITDSKFIGSWILEGYIDKVLTETDLVESRYLISDQLVISFDTLRNELTTFGLLNRNIISLDLVSIDKCKTDKFELKFDSTQNIIILTDNLEKPSKTYIYKLFTSDILHPSSIASKNRMTFIKSNLIGDYYLINSTNSDKTVSITGDRITGLSEGENLIIWTNFSPFNTNVLTIKDKVDSKKYHEYHWDLINDTLILRDFKKDTLTSKWISEEIKYKLLKK